MDKIQRTYEDRNSLHIISDVFVVSGLLPNLSLYSCKEFQFWARPEVRKRLQHYKSELRFMWTLPAKRQGSCPLRRGKGIVLRTSSLRIKPVQNPETSGAKSHRGI